MYSTFKNFNEIFYISFFILNVQGPEYIFSYSTAQFAPASYHVLSSHKQVMATISDTVAKGVDLESAHHKKK